MKGGGTNPSALDTPAMWADVIAQRVGTYENGLWLPRLGEWLALADARWLPESSEQEPVTVRSAIRAVQLVLYALPSYDRAPKRARAHHIVLDEAVFDAQLVEQHPEEAGLPFGLEPADETPATASEKLGSTDLYHGKGSAATRMSWTLDDQRVVELDFRAQFTGLRRVHVVRLWKPVPMRR